MQFFASMALATLATASTACAPLSSFRPASGIMEGRSGEVGFGGSLAGPRPYVDERTRGSGQMWLSKRASKDLTLTGIGAVEASAFALGGSAKIDVLRTNRFAFGPDVQLGFLFAAVDAGAALRLFDETWIYTAPRFGNRGATWAIEIPAGVSSRIFDAFMLRAEYRVSWAGELSYYQQRRMFGAALAYQF